MPGLLRAGGASSAPPYAPLLSPGPFAVGFRSTWVFDEGRTYSTAYDEGETYGAEKAPRPLFVLLWVPSDPAGAGVQPMPHGAYFSVASADPRLARYADALVSYARGVFVEQVLGKPEAELDEEERAKLEASLAAPTLCRPGAEPAGGPFPLVVYHCGAGSSFEDNAGLCEYLASHGYVVLGSAFPRADGSSLGIDAGRGSAEDVQFLVRWARALPFADWRHVALVGHSAGAQALLKYAAQPGCVGDLLVLLDTTQDYYGLGMPLHESLVREATEGSARLTRPMLVAAGPEALFARCSSASADSSRAPALHQHDAGRLAPLRAARGRASRRGRALLLRPEGALAARAEPVRVPVRHQHDAGQARAGHALPAPRARPRSRGSQRREQAAQAGGTARQVSACRDRRIAGSDREVTLL